MPELGSGESAEKTAVPYADLVTPIDKATITDVAHAGFTTIESRLEDCRVPLLRPGFRDEVQRAQEAKVRDGTPNDILRVDAQYRGHVDAYEFSLSELGQGGTPISSDAHRRAWIRAGSPNTVKLPPNPKDHIDVAGFERASKQGLGRIATALEDSLVSSRDLTLLEKKAVDPTTVSDEELGRRKAEGEEKSYRVVLETFGQWELIQAADERATKRIIAATPSEATLAKIRAGHEHKFLDSRKPAVVEDRKGMESSLAGVRSKLAEETRSDGSTAEEVEKTDEKTLAYSNALQKSIDSHGGIEKFMGVSVYRAILELERHLEDNLTTLHRPEFRSKLREAMQARREGKIVGNMPLLDASLRGEVNAYEVTLRNLGQLAVIEDARSRAKSRIVATDDLELPSYGKGSIDIASLKDRYVKRFVGIARDFEGALAYARDPVRVEESMRNSTSTSDEALIRMREEGRCKGYNKIIEEFSLGYLGSAVSDVIAKRFTKPTE